MNDFETLVYLLDTTVKNNIKEGDYLALMNTVSKIYRDKIKEVIVSDDEDCDNDYGGQYC